MTSPWWFLKILGGLALVAYGVVHALGLVPLLPQLGVPTPVAQTLILIGAGIHLSHYLVLKRATSGLDEPDHLVTDIGLFRVVRHPMYLGDVLLYTGLALMVGDAAVFGLLAVSLVAIERQARLEDRELATLFGVSYDAWQDRTRLLLPGLV